MNSDFTRILVVLVGAGILAACQPSPQGPADYVTNAAEIVNKADWSKMQTITVEMDEHNYHPRDLTLKVGQPYRIILKNTGEKEHYYTAPEFFKAIATRKAQVNKVAEFKAPYFTAIEVYKNGQAELFFVPVKRGTYPVICTIDDHREKGMEGKLIVE